MPRPRKVHTILIVDDEARLRRALERSFQQEGYQTRGAACGEEALVVLQEEQVDLVITDLVMPGMEGMALVRSVLGSDPAAKVIIITAYGSAESMAEAEALGVAYYLSKPFDLSHLKSRVRELLKGSQTSRCSLGRLGALALGSVCGVACKAVGVVVGLPGRALPYIRPGSLVFTAGKVVGVVSGLYLGLWRRFGEAR